MQIEDTFIATAIQTAFASAAFTAAQNSSDLCSNGARGLEVYINVTAAVSSPSVTFTIQGKDSISGVYFTVLASAAITGAGFTVLRVYPGLTASSNVTANDVIPRFFRIAVAAGNSNSLTYSVSINLIP